MVVRRMGHFPGGRLPGKRLRALTGIKIQRQLEGSFSAVTVRGQEDPSSLVLSPLSSEPVCGERAVEKRWFNRPLPMVVRRLGHFPGGRLPGKRCRALTGKLSSLSWRAVSRPQRSAAEKILRPLFCPTCRAQRAVNNDSIATRANLPASRTGQPLHGIHALHPANRRKSPLILGIQQMLHLVEDLGHEVF